MTSSNFITVGIKMNEDPRKFLCQWKIFKECRILSDCRKSLFMQKSIISAKDYLSRKLNVSKRRRYWRKYLLKRDSTTISTLLCSKINTYFYEPSALPARQCLSRDTSHLDQTESPASLHITCIVANSADLSQKISICFHRIAEHRTEPQVRREPQGSSSPASGSSIRRT